MAKKKLGIGTFDIDKRFKDKEEAFRYAKRLREVIKYNCKKRNWSAQAIICISNIKGSSSFIYLEQNGKVGRPKKVRYNYSEDLILDWHIHVLIVSKPNYAFRKVIKDYIDKNWFGGKKKEFLYNGKKVYKKNCNINKVEYFIDQSSEVLFCNYNCNDLIPKGYSLKDLYNAYLKSKTALKYCGKYLDNWEEKLKIDNAYYDIKNFYYRLSEKEDKESSDKFMKEMRLRKIAERYEQKENENQANNNYVQNINRRRIEDNSPI